MQLRQLSLAAGVLLAGGAISSIPATPAHADVDVRYTYEIHTRGNTSVSADSFADHVERTLDDPRGWTLGGAIDFDPVPDGGHFNLVLATPEAVEAAAPGCSRQWSCRVGDDILINEYRWVHGTDAYHRPLDQYRHYVVNHEVGHWLGLDHTDCPGAGEAAPVMMQQSKGLDGCTTTVWPLEWEQEIVENREGARMHEVARSDLLWYEAWNDAGVTVARSSGSGFGFDGQWIEGWGGPDWSAAADVDNDGFSDLVWYETWNDQGVTVGLSDGRNGFLHAGQWATDLEQPTWAAAGDVNGDGADDLVWYRTAGGGTVDVYLSTASTFVHAGTWASGWGAPDWAGLADVDGDDRDDLIWYEAWNDHGVTVGLSNGDDAFGWAGQWYTELQEPEWADTGDANGDGEADLVWYSHKDDGTVDVLTSTGSSFFASGAWVKGWGTPEWAAAGDVDLDGDADLVWYETWNADVTVGVSDGDSFDFAGRWIHDWGAPGVAFLANAG